MTPLEISIALWYHCRVGDFGRFNGDNNFDAPAVQSAIKEFVDKGLLVANPVPNECIYRGTRALTVYVDALCGVPLPVQEWVIPKSGTYQ